MARISGLVFIICLCAGLSVCQLTISGNHFHKGPTKVFLSGSNAAWVSLGYDFGNNQYQQRHTEYLGYLDHIYQNGGNSIRIFVHSNCDTTPNIDSNGITLGPDSGGTIIDDMKKLLDEAQARNIVVFFVLFNGAEKKSSHWKLQGLIIDDQKRQKYIENALQPIVRALKSHRALGGWDIINEMEGIIRVENQNGDSCFDTTFLDQSGAGWAGQTYSAQDLLRFLNHVADGIKQVDSGALITSGSWNIKSNTDSFGFHNLYKDECLRKAGGRMNGVLSFYSTHTYAVADACQCHYDNLSPFYRPGRDKNDYSLKKPLVIAEFSQHQGDGWKIEDQYNHAYSNNYAGAWGWQYKQEPADQHQDDAATINKGLRSLKGKRDCSKGGTVNFDV